MHLVVIILLIGCNGGIGAGAVAGADGETGMFLGREGKGAHWRFVLPAHPLLMHQQLFAPNVIFPPWRSVHAVHPYQSAPKPNFSPSVWQLVHHPSQNFFALTSILQSPSHKTVL